MRGGRLRTCRGRVRATGLGAAVRPAATRTRATGRVRAPAMSALEVWEDGGGRVARAASAATSLLALPCW
eukprot:352986-Chlamydomonas_euryale.AAC.23